MLNIVVCVVKQLFHSASVYQTYNILSLSYMYSFAEIKLTLSNVGQDSYQPEVYGRRVIIVRRIQKEGSSYKLMSTDGKCTCIYSQVVVLCAVFRV